MIEMFLAIEYSRLVFNFGSEYGNHGSSGSSVSRSSRSLELTRLTYTELEMFLPGFIHSLKHVPRY